MKLGLKVNADNEFMARLDGAHPSFVEVWFNASAHTHYEGLFAELARRNCDAGLHFWGLLEDHIAPNIAYPDTHVIRESMALMKRTIDIAHTHKFSYVNIHPGASALAKVNYENERYDVVTDAIPTDTAINLFLEHAEELSKYARERNVVFTVETVPARITHGWYDPEARNKPNHLHELPVEAIQQAASRGIWVANDFCHTAANIIADNPHDVWTFVRDTTVRLADKTRLIHLGFVMPPYNGTDNHDMLNNPIFDTDAAVPNKSQMIELLRLFENRQDIWMLVEPKEDHVTNYMLAQKLLDEAKTI
jgi:sugar phosphate isomerase/epimerase